VIDEKLANAVISREEETEIVAEEDKEQVDQEMVLEDPNSYLSMIPTVFLEMRSKWLAYEPTGTIEPLFDSIDEFLSLNSQCTISRLKNQDLEFIVYILTFNSIV
jgi:hypothetical protein